MKEIAALVASLLAILGNVPYLTDIVRHKVKPHPYTWFVWSIVSCIVFFGQLEKGAGIGAIPTAAAEIFTIIIFLLSLQYSFFKDIRPIDTVFLVLALAGLVPWYLTHDPTISVVIAVSIDFVAFLPTIRKTWRAPKTETPLLYASNVFRHALMLVSLQAYNVATMLHSLVMITLNSIMTGIITLRKRHD